MKTNTDNYRSSGFWSSAQEEEEGNPYDLPQWKHPSDYGGFSPEGDFGVVGQTRDSEALDRSNYERIFEDLQAFAEQFGDAPERDDIESGDMPWVYDFRASHWAVGWVEYVLVRQDAPDALQGMVREILDALANYPVYDDEHFSQLEYEEREEAEEWEDEEEEEEEAPEPKDQLDIDWYDADETL